VNVDSGAGLEGEPDTIFDREPELAEMFAALERAGQGEMPIALVTGDSGTGKTFLLQHFARSASKRNADVLVLSSAGEALAGRATSLRPVRQMLAQLTGLSADVKSSTSSPGLAEDRSKHSRAPALRALLGEAPELIDILLPAPSLADWKSVGLPPEEFKSWVQGGLEGRRSHSGDPAELTRGVARLLAAFHGRTVLLLDDLQWIDAASFNLFLSLSHEIPEGRILRIGTAMTGRDSQPLPNGMNLDALTAGIRRNSVNLVIDLNRTREVRGTAFCREALENWKLPPTPENTEALFSLTGANALFVRDTLAALTQDKSFGVSGVLTGEIDWSGLPTRLVDNINKRLAQVSDTATKLLEAASVEGNVFTVDVLCAVHGMDRLDVLRLLDTELAKENRLIRDISDSLSNKTGHSDRARFQFVHDLYRRHIYNAVLGSSHRAELHGRVARAIEALSDDDSRAVQLAHHYDLAGEAGPAVRCYANAAGHSLCLYDYEAAGECARRGLELGRAPQHREIIEHVRKLYEVGAIAARVRGLFRESETITRSGLADKEIVVAPQTKLILQSELARSLYNQDREFDEAERLLLEALRVKADPKQETHAARSDLRRQLGVLYQRQGRYIDALSEYSNGLGSRDLAPISLLTADLVNSVGVSSALCGRLQLATQFQQLALYVASAARNESRDTLFLNDLSAAFRKLNRLEDAEVACQAAEALATRQGKRGALTRARYEHAQVARLQENWDLYEQRLEKVTREKPNLGGQGPYVPAAAAELALLWLRKAESGPVPQRLLADVEEQSLVTGTSELYSANLVQALLALHEGHLAKARINAQNLLSRVEELREPLCWSWPFLKGFAHLVIAAADGGTDAEARNDASSAFATASDRFGQSGIWQEVAFLGGLIAAMTSSEWPPTVTPATRVTPKERSDSELDELLRSIWTRCESIRDLASINDD
jgi:hypothetical protein